jgi:glycosyltransferase involved in cell wall biosynthesis
VAGFLDYEGFFLNVSPNLPLVWRLADMNPLTGGCHYDGGCGRFANQCGACPQLSSSDPNDLSHQIWARKNQSLARLAPNRLHLVATSRWIAAEAQRSSLLARFPVTVIPNGLDTGDFAPRDRGYTRDLLGIPQHAKVVLFVADDADNVRKGFKLLAEALRGIENVSDLLLLSLGVGRPVVGGDVRHLHLGKIANDRFLSAVYSAADVYVIASLQESFGQTVTESLACGTPVVGFASGGIPDMVRPGQTGLLAPTGDVPALRAAVAQLLNDSAQRTRMSAECRRLALAEYSLDVQARAYGALYRSLLEPSTPPSVRQAVGAT